MKIKIALDVIIGRKRAEELAKMGYEIVVVANQSEPDEEWILRALKAKAEFVISADLDIPHIIEDNQYPMFWVKYHCDGKDSSLNKVKFIDQSIQNKLGLIANYKSDFGKLSESVLNPKKDWIHGFIAKLKSFGSDLFNCFPN